MFKKFSIFFGGIIGFIIPLSASAQYGLDETAAKLGYSETSIYAIIGQAISTGLSLIGLFFFGLMMYAGLRWMTARGKEELVEKATNTLQAASIGFIVAVLSYALTTFILKSIAGG